MIKRICQCCGNEYETFESIRKKFCSAACFAKSKENHTIEKCSQCGKEFKKIPSMPTQRFCSRSCATTSRNLTSQNPSYHRDITGSNNPMYGKGMIGQDNPMYGKRREKCPRWKGGRKIRKDGYILVVAPDGYPNPADSYHKSISYVLEHRLVVETNIGRYLNQDEVVHHINGNTSDNRIENLQLINSQAEHAALHKKTIL